MSLDIAESMVTSGDLDRRFCLERSQELNRSGPSLCVGIQDFPDQSTKTHRGWFRIPEVFTVNCVRLSEKEPGAWAMTSSRSWAVRSVPRAKKQNSAIRLIFK